MLANMLKKLSIICISIVLVECRSHSERNRFDEFKSKVDKEVFVGFPIKEREDLVGSINYGILFPVNVSISGYCGVFVTFDINSINIEQLLNTSKDRFYAKDSCNFFIPVQTFRDKDCKQSSIPIPRLNDEFGIMKGDSLGPLDEFIVFNSSVGEYIIDSPDFENNQKTSYVDHGFSNGVFVSRDSNRIIYWLIIW